MSFDFLLSTEGSSARQNINQLGINPSWGWGNAHLGDFTDMFTPLTFDGIMVRGAGVNLNPGLLRFSAIGGFTQSAVQGGAGNGTYSRYIYGARLGIGKEGGSYFDISFLRARDNPSSLPSPKPTIVVVAPNGGDAWPIGNIETIRWASSGVYGNIKIELSRDGGSTFVVLFDSIANTGTQPWVVAGPPTSQAIIRVTSLADSVSSVSNLPFTIGLGITEQQGTTPGIIANTFAVTPQENLVTGADGRLSLFDNAFAIGGEIDGSVYTQDMQATTVDSLKFPPILTGLYKPRTSSRADFAYDANAALNFRNFNARLDYQYIGPGYTSLGVASLLPDQRNITLATMFRIAQVSVNINAGHQNDNLLDQKSYTTNRNNIGGNINLQVSNVWTMSMMSTYLSMVNNAASDTFKVDYSTFTAGMTHMFFIGAQSLIQSATLSYIYQTSADDNPLRQGSGLISHSLNASIVLEASDDLNIIPAASVIESKIGGVGWTSTQTYSISGQYRTFENRLSTSLSVGISLVQGANSLQTSLASTYSITSADAVTVSLMDTGYNGSNNFNEHTASLTLAHRF